MKPSTPIPSPVILSVLDFFSPIRIDLKYQGMEPDYNPRVQ